MDSDAATLAELPRPLRLLVVDDDRINRRVLCAMLEQAGHATLPAENGVEAVAVFEREQPDMVLMDIMMPVMDGYEATRAIKARAGRNFVPVIFITAVSDEDGLARCVEAGGDDFLTKPYSRVILQAKMNALLRTRALTRTMERQHDELAGHHRRLQQEQAVAERLFRNIVHRGCLDAPNIHYLISPAALFNGDLLLAARHPSGGLRVLLGDFAGHGLPAAVGAIPVSEIFYVMTAKGYSIAETVSEINRKLHAILPVGQFLAACLADIDRGGRHLTLWNGGIPDALVRTANGRLQRLPSRHLPLGVVGNDALDRSAEVLDLTPGDRLYLFTDGIIEARGHDGQMFGQPRLERELTAPHASFATLCARLSAHRGGRAPEDDSTLIEVTVLAQPETAEDATSRNVGARHPGNWRVGLELDATVLRSADPLPVILQTVMELQGIHEHRERLYVILSELFLNAVDHGLLRLDSTLKATPEGFGAYYAAREHALAALGAGRIQIELAHRPAGRGGCLSVRVRDSGSGFDPTVLSADITENTTYAGRGVALVRSLCRELVYHDGGRCVEAVYAWD